DLESRALRLAIANLDKATIARARRILDETEAAQDYLASWSARNWAFHSTLYAAADRPRLLHMIEVLHGHTERYLQLHVAMHNYRKTGQREHRELLKLAARRDTKGALTCLAAHIGDVYALLEPYLVRRASATSLKRLRD
ncbi:MAG TPA: FCD domain-containing protein, partial [Candidatus Baltobacteraceae bacterium]|nr:FCD domain-containing protein [Candidatus Baltobacteraceae bacterium]